MPHSITPLLRAKLLAELQVLRDQILQYLEADHATEYQQLRQQLAQHPLSHWPELMQHWLTPELQQKCRRLSLVQAALSQMDMGLYGLCSDCESRIERTLLQEDPARQRCAACEQIHQDQRTSQIPLRSR